MCEGSPIKFGPKSLNILKMSTLDYTLLKCNRAYGKPVRDLELGDITLELIDITLELHITLKFSDITFY